MTNIWHIFDVMTNLLMRWQIFWRDDVLLTSWRTFWSNDEPFVLMTYFDIMTNILKSGQTDFLKSWRVYDIITNLWRHSKHSVSNIFDVMVNVLALWKFLMTWHTIWCHDTLFDVMVCSLLQGECCVVMTYSMTCLYCPDIFLHHFGNKILWKRVFDVIDIMIYFLFYGRRLTSCHVFDELFDVMANLLTSWYVFDIMTSTNLLTSWRVFFCKLTYFWLHCITFWSMLHLLTSWRTFWCHGSFDDMTHFLCPDARHVFLYYDEPFCRDDVCSSLFREQNIM